MERELIRNNGIFVRGRLKKEGKLVICDLDYRDEFRKKILPAKDARTGQAHLLSDFDYFAIDFADIYTKGSEDKVVIVGQFPKNNPKDRRLFDVFDDDPKDEKARYRDNPVQQGNLVCRSYKYSNNIFVITMWASGTCNIRNVKIKKDEKGEYYLYDNIIFGAPAVDLKNGQDSEGGLKITPELSQNRVFQNIILGLFENYNNGNYVK